MHTADVKPRNLFQEAERKIQSIGRDFFLQLFH